MVTVPREQLICPQLTSTCRLGEDGAIERRGRGVRVTTTPPHDLREQTPPQTPKHPRVKKNPELQEDTPKGDPCPSSLLIPTDTDSQGQAPSQDSSPQTTQHSSEATPFYSGNVGAKACPLASLLVPASCKSLEGDIKGGGCWLAGRLP